jgi:hypothetical protein
MSNDHKLHMGHGAEALVLCKVPKQHQQLQQQQHHVVRAS